MSRIGVTGCQNSGKTTLIKDILAKWPGYTTPDKTYRDILKEKGLPCNQNTTPETQTIIMDFLCDQIIGKTSTDCIITDRTPIDALVFSMYQNFKGVEGFTDEYIEKQIILARESLSFYDIIFHIPIVAGHDIPLVADDLRDIDPSYRTEINNIFSAIFSTYFTQTGPYFKFGDCPAVIEIFGTPEERMEMVKLYLDDSGNPFGEDESLVTDGIMTLDGTIYETDSK